MSDHRDRALHDEFTRGFLVCLCSYAGAFNEASSTQASYLFQEIGNPSAKEVRRLQMSDYDRSVLNDIRKWAR